MNIFQNGIEGEATYEMNLCHTFCLSWYRCLIGINSRSHQYGANLSWSYIGLVKSPCSISGVVSVVDVDRVESADVVVISGGEDLTVEGLEPESAVGISCS
jgi:hypothetical protein